MPWLRATFLGWFLGLVILVALAALCDLFGGGAQFMVGVGMGLGVGYLQSRILMRWMPDAWRWWVASAFGMGALFVLHDVFKLAGVPFPFSPPLYVVLGGLFVGFLQLRLLRKLSGRAHWWVPASTFGWALPAAAVALGDAQNLGPWREPIGLVGMFGGGLLLGVVSGAVMLWIFSEAGRECRSDELPRPVEGRTHG